MSKADLYQRLNSAYEITLSVKGRKSGRDIPRPVWFVHEHNTLYLLPNYGSDTNWYRNFLANQTLKISVSGEEIPARGKPITDSSRIRDVMSKFGSKYGDVRKYYPKPDVAVRSRFDKSCRELPISDGDLILNITKRLEANRHAVLL